MVSLYMGGGEINAFGELLESMGVDTITVSYMGLRRRIKHLDKVNLADRFSADAKILLDSGCHSINSTPDRQHSDEELKQIAAEYDEFVERNLEALHAYTEFDALQLGREWIADRRRGGKQIVVWHEEDGLEELETLCKEHGAVGVTGTALGDRDLTPILRRAAKDGTRLFGLGMTKPEQMRDIPWTGVTSTSWLSPVKFRDLIVWTGHELKRYPKKNRESGKRRHRTLFAQIGLDTDLIDDDDGTELLKLSIWSWVQQLAHINGTPSNAQIATIPADTPDTGNAENGGEGVAKQRTRMRIQEATTNTPTPRPKKQIPGMEVEEKNESYTDSGGTKRTRKLKLVKSTNSSFLQCSGCHMAGTCPEFDPGSDCAFEIPADAETPAERQAQMRYLINRQFRRTAFGLVTEEVGGGYPDSNVSREIGLYQKLLKAEHDMAQEGFSLTIKASQHAANQSAGAGVLSRIFGREPVEQEQRAELPPPVPQKSAEEQLGIMEAEVIEVDQDNAA